MKNTQLLIFSSQKNITVSLQESNFYYYYYYYCYCACFTAYMYIYDNAGNFSPINRWQQVTLDFKGSSKDHC